MLARALISLALVTLAFGAKIEEDTLVLFFPTYTLDSKGEYHQAQQTLKTLVGDGQWPALRMAYSVPDNFEQHLVAMDQVEIKVHAVSSRDGQIYTARQQGRKLDNVAMIEGWNSIRQGDYSWITTHSAHACSEGKCTLPPTAREQVIMAFANCMLDLRALNLTKDEVHFIYVTILKEEAEIFNPLIEEVRKELWPDGTSQPVIYIQEVGKSISFDPNHRLSLWPFYRQIGDYIVQLPSRINICMET